MVALVLPFVHKMMSDGFFYFTVMLSIALFLLVPLSFLGCVIAELVFTLKKEDFTSLKSGTPTYVSLGLAFGLLVELIFSQQSYVGENMFLAFVYFGFVSIVGLLAFYYTRYTLEKKQSSLPRQ